MTKLGLAILITLHICPSWAASLVLNDQSEFYQFHLYCKDDGLVKDIERSFGAFEEKAQTSNWLNMNTIVIKTNVIDDNFYILGLERGDYPGLNNAFWKYAVPLDTMKTAGCTFSNY